MIDVGPDPDTSGSYYARVADPYAGMITSEPPPGTLRGCNSVEAVRALEEWASDVVHACRAWREFRGVPSLPAVEI